MPVSRCRVKSSEASQRTISRRKTLSQLRDSISGGDGATQMQSEIRALTREEREAVLREANLPIVVSPDKALAIKADLALPWAKMRMITR